ncbi:MAG: beta-N-acetylglucosaminidase domain-containing protein [Atopobiaceae bacterium]|nr:beta-N-acetylglucosaminidase domain-containing protein [Atopobiaceae bacterium]
MKQVRKAGHGPRWFAAGSLAVAAAVCSAVALAQPAQAEDATTYTLYPTPQVMTYDDGTITLGDTVDVVVEDGIDDDTVARLNEALDLKGITSEEATAPDADGQVDVLVGIEGSGDVVDQYVDTAGLTIEDGLFEKTDAYLLALTPASNGSDARIVVLGKDTDSAFYGLTTVYQLFQQVDGDTVRAFTVSDWADVVSRGFIEGYYGNPWSQEDREELMRWGGYHKLNVYVYAPKDDNNHRLQWRHMYDDEGIKKIEALAAAGNESKCRFVYALLPFYAPGEIDSNTEESLGVEVDDKFNFNNYAEDLVVLKARYLQVIDAGVRQIALLADDAKNMGGQNYLKLLKDLTAWLEELQKEVDPKTGELKYPGLKTTIPYVGAQWTYTGTGEAWYKDAPESVQFVVTGGQTFGSVNADFISKVQTATGRNPFMWINWPCTDPLPNYLTMGGHNTFLEDGVEPGSVDGIMLNPMQQSQPSKQGIFMVSDYAWNLWDSEDHADQVWQDSFSYLEDNSPNATEASDALRELSMHMRMSTAGTTNSTYPRSDYSASVPGQTRSFSFWINDESVDFSGETNPAGAMTAIKEAVEDGGVTAEDIAAARPTYQSIVDAANTYEESHTNTTMWEQISPFIKALRDKAQASLLYLDVIEATNGNNADAASALLAQAEKTYAASTSYTYNQLGTDYEARAGHEYVEPTLNALRTYASDAVAEASADEVDRESMKVTAGSVESDGTPTEGPVSYASDGNESTFWSSDWDGTTLNNLWLQIAFDKPTSVSALRYLPRQTTGDIVTQGSANGTVTEYKVLYSDNGTDWREATTGSWPDHTDKSWRTASFDTPVTAKYFRLQAVHTFMADNAKLDTSMSCAEIRLVAAPKVDYSALVQAVAKAEALDTSGKTAESVSALEQAIAAARALYVNSDADATQITAAIEKLDAAIAGLTDEPTIFTVTFVGAQGVEDQTVEEGKTATEPKVTVPAGYTFGGWLLNGEKYDFSEPVTSDITLTASWVHNKPTGEEPGGNEPGTGEQPGSDEKPGQPTTPDPGKPGSGSTGGSLAQTGDPTSAVAAIATALAGAGALAASRRRR